MVSHTWSRPMMCDISGLFQRQAQRRWDLVYNDKLTVPKWALNSAVECHPHTVEVVGSNPTAPTILAL